MVKQKNWRLYYTPVSSHLKRFDNRMKIGLCTGENVPDPVLTTASARRVFKSLRLLRNPQNVELRILRTQTWEFGVVRIFVMLELNFEDL